MMLLAVLSVGCWTPREAEVTRWAKAGRVDRLTDVVADRRVAPEVRALAATALFELRQDREVEAILTEVPANERSPVVAYLLHGFLPELLARDAERGHAAMLIIRPFGSPDSVERADRLLLLSVIAALQHTEPDDPRYATLLARLEIVAPGHPRLLLPLLETPGAPAETVLRLLSPHPDLLAAARQTLVRRVRQQGPADEGLLRTLARWGPLDPVIAELSRGGPRAISAARALAFAAPDPNLARLALDVAEDASAPPPLRTAMLTVLARMRPVGVRPRLLRLIRQDSHLQVRLQSFRTLTALEGEPAVLPALESFPRNLELSRTDVVTHLAPGLRNAGPEEARRLARAALRSRAPLARLTGILVLEELGERQDADLLAGLARRRGPFAAEATRVARYLESPTPNAGVAQR
jgi:hypothetical protein